MKTKAKLTDVYLIVCEGQGDMDVGLVNEETWNWVFSDFNSVNGFGYHEKIPQSILDAYPPYEYQDTNVFVTSGSYDNDRALLCPKMHFDSIKKAKKYVHTHKLTLIDEFYGCIY